MLAGIGCDLSWGACWNPYVETCGSFRTMRCPSFRELSWRDGTDAGEGGSSRRRSLTVSSTAGYVSRHSKKGYYLDCAKKVEKISNTGEPKEIEKQANQIEGLLQRSYALYDALVVSVSGLFPLMDMSQHIPVAVRTADQGEKLNVDSLRIGGRRSRMDADARTSQGKRG